MSNAHRSDALARALDILAEDDPARSDPRLVRDPALAADARAARETAAEVWLAVSPLRAAPADALPEILGRLSPSPTSQITSRFPHWIMIGGWAAAAAIALAWLILSLRPQPAATSPELAAPNSTSPAAQTSAPRDMPAASAPSRVDRDRTLDELVRLRRVLAAERRSSSETLQPRVVELSAPGAGRFVDSQESRERLLGALANALRVALEDERDDPASLVIERGWLGEGGIHLAAEDRVRHRNFPVDTWSDHALLRSEDGGFFDPSSGLLWEKDPASTDYIGRKATAEDDLEAFQQRDNTKEQDPPAYVQSMPAGFVIEDPASGQAHLVLDSLSPLPEGSTYLLVGNSSAGGSVSFTVASSSKMSSFALPNNISDFTLIQSDATGNRHVILSGGK